MVNTYSEFKECSGAGELLSVAMDIGQGMLQSGAEISRVENTVERICYAYGAQSVDVFCIPSLMIASVRTPSGRYASRMRRVREHENNMMRIEGFNAVSRDICKHTPPLGFASKMIKAVYQRRIYPPFLKFLCAAVSAGVFSVFFGGSALDGICAAVIGSLIYLINRYALFGVTKLAKSAICAAVAGMLSCSLVLLGAGDNASAIMIGTIILLLPGLSFGSAIRNLLSGEVLSGTVDVVRSALTALMIALGYLSSLLIFRFESVSIAPANAILRIFMLFIGLICLAVIFSTKPSRTLYIAFGGTVTFLISYALSLNSAAPFFCAFFAACFASVYSEVSARAFGAPSTVFLLPCTVSIMPGEALYRAMNHLLSARPTLSAEALYGAASTAFGIACAVIFVSVIISLYESFKKVYKKTRKLKKSLDMKAKI